MAEATPAAIPHVRRIPSLTLTGAEWILGRALADAARRDVAVAVVVADRAGQLLCAARMDLAPGVSSEIAARKAFTAAQLGAATRIFQQSIDAGRASYLAAGALCCIAGGVPVWLGDEIVGAIGVSGASEDADHAIAHGAAASLPA